MVSIIVVVQIFVIVIIVIPPPLPGMHLTMRLVVASYNKVIAVVLAVIIAADCIGK